LFRSRTEEDLDAYLLRITDFFKHLTWTHYTEPQRP
jgi:hypothetical protein